MNNERCESYNETTGNCSYAEGAVVATGKIGNKCQTGGLCDGCNKAHSVVSPQGGAIHLLITEQGKEKGIVWKYPPDRR